jgi:hypothetical protein
VRKSVIIFSVFVLAGCGTMNKKPSTQSVDVLPPPKSESDIAAAKAQEAIVEDAEIKEIEKNPGNSEPDKRRFGHHGF